MWSKPRSAMRFVPAGANQAQAEDPRKNEMQYMRSARQRSQQMKGYFDDDSDEEERNAHTSATATVGSNANDDEVDPLDAFMLGIDQQVKKEDEVAKCRTKPMDKPERMDHQDEVFDKFVEMSKKEVQLGDSAEYEDSDEEVYAMAAAMEEGTEGRVPTHKMKIEELEPLDHSSIHYEPFRKNFYREHPTVAAMPHHEVVEFQKELDVKTSGDTFVRPIKSFMHAGFSKQMLNEILRQGFEAPTPIQCQALPIALGGRDVIGIAKTGSGKTLAFVWPMVVHLLDQPHLAKGDGPIAVILAPTRELALQILTETKKFTKPFGAKCAAVYGGTGKWEQTKALKEGAEVVIATPGRMIDMIKNKVCPMNRVTYLVLDEADRMFELGFEPQVRSVVGQTRPDRQTLLFSATFRRRIENLARDILSSPIKINVGRSGQANEDIQLQVVVMEDDSRKWNWLTANLRKFVDIGKVLVFVDSKAGCEELSTNLDKAGFPTVAIHGDRDQSDRYASLTQFKKGVVRVLVATDVAARGLDIKDIRTVVEFDIARKIDTHVHRIGRTGRMGVDGVVPGNAYTLITQKQAHLAGPLVDNMDKSGHEAPRELVQLATKNPKWRRGMNTDYADRPAKRSSADQDRTESANQGPKMPFLKSNKKRVGLGFHKGAPQAAPPGSLSQGTGEEPGHAKAMSFVRSTTVLQPDTETSRPTGIIMGSTSGSQAGPLATHNSHFQASEKSKESRIERNISHSGGAYRRSRSRSRERRSQDHRRSRSRSRSRERDRRRQSRWDSGRDSRKRESSDRYSSNHRRRSRSRDRYRSSRRSRSRS